MSDLVKTQLTEDKDALSGLVFALIAKRASVMQAVAGNKYLIGKAIFDPVQEETILNNLKAKAEREGWPVTEFLNFCHAQMDYAKLIQGRFQAVWTKSSSFPFVKDTTSLTSAPSSSQDSEAAEASKLKFPNAWLASEEEEQRIVNEVLLEIRSEDFGTKEAYEPTFKNGSPLISLGGVRDIIKAIDQRLFPAIREAAQELNALNDPIITSGIDGKLSMFCEQTVAMLQTADAGSVAVAETDHHSLGIADDFSRLTYVSALRSLVGAC